MNLWADKLIKLPPSVVKLLNNKIMISPSSYSELFRKFHGLSGQTSQVDLVPCKRSAYINTTSGMMQGILHYCSSLLHLCFLASAKHCTLRFLNQKYKKIRI